jgi:hypothetical protein
MQVQERLQRQGRVQHHGQGHQELGEDAERKSRQGRMIFLA